MGGIRGMGGSAIFFTLAEKLGIAFNLHDNIFKLFKINLAWHNSKINNQLWVINMSSAKLLVRLLNEILEIYFCLR